MRMAHHAAKISSFGWPDGESLMTQDIRFFTLKTINQMCMRLESAIETTFPRLIWPWDEYHYRPHLIDPRGKKCRFLLGHFTFWSLLTHHHVSLASCDRWNQGPEKPWKKALVQTLAFWKGWTIIHGTCRGVFWIWVVLQTKHTTLFQIWHEQRCASYLSNVAKDARFSYMTVILWPF